MRRNPGINVVLVLRHLYHRSVDSDDLFCDFRLGLGGDRTLLTNCGVERHSYHSSGLGYGYERGLFPIEKMDDFKPHAELVVMLVIGLRAANYIKLVSQGYVPFSSTHRNM